MITSQDSQDEWLTLDDAARRFHVSRRTLERLRKQGVLPGIRIGRYLSVRTVDVQQALARRSPLQTYRHQAKVNPDMPARDWLLGWRTMVEGKPALASTRKWIDRVIDDHGADAVGELKVGHVVECGRELPLKGDSALIFEALSGIDADRGMLATTRTLLTILVPAI